MLIGVGAVENGLDAVAVGVKDKGRIIAARVWPQSGAAVISRPCRKGCFVEGINTGGIRRAKGQMRAAARAVCVGLQAKLVILADAI